MSEDEELSVEESKSNFFHNKNNNDLYDDKRYEVINPFVRVKFFKRKGQEGWQILENDKVKITISSKRLSKEEKSLLFTVDGLNVLLQSYKDGIISISGLRERLKEKCGK